MQNDLVAWSTRGAAEAVGRETICGGKEVVVKTKAGDCEVVLLSARQDRSDTCSLRARPVDAIQPSALHGWPWLRLIALSFFRDRIG
jgi:hypothetical protein